jgi:hypothetical protein
MFPGVYTIEFSGTIGTLGDTRPSGPEGNEDPFKNLVQAEERHIRVFSSPEGKEVLARMREDVVATGALIIAAHRLTVTLRSFCESSCATLVAAWTNASAVPL